MTHEEYKNRYKHILEYLSNHPYFGKLRWYYEGYVYSTIGEFQIYVDASMYMDIQMRVMGINDSRTKVRMKTINECAKNLEEIIKIDPLYKKLKNNIDSLHSSSTEEDFILL